MWSALHAELVALDDAFAGLDAAKMKSVLNKTRTGARGSGKFSPAKASAALCLDVHALDAEPRHDESVDRARTRIAKSFRQAAQK